MGPGNVVVVVVVGAVVVVGGLVVVVVVEVVDERAAVDVVAAAAPGLASLELQATAPKATEPARASAATALATSRRGERARHTQARRCACVPGDPSSAMAGRYRRADLAGAPPPTVRAMAAASFASRPAPTDLEWSVVRGIAGFRWLALTWAAVVLFLTRAVVDGRPLGITLLLLALVVTAVSTEASIRRRRWVFHPIAVAAELAVGASMLLLDGSVYSRPHSQSLGSAWPIAGILMAAVVAGPLGGAASGVVLGLSRWGGAVLADFTKDQSLSLVSSGVLFAIAGAAAGTAMDRVRKAETVIAEARARDEVARTLHDGVLQTLAVVQRRSSDAELAALAREQELELRAYLAGDRPQLVELGAALRETAARVERRDGLRVEVLFVDDDHPTVAPAVVEAVAGAVGEALTNAHKHGSATRATVFVDVDDEVFCSVKDDGQGFDPAAVSPGAGTTGSIHGRLATVGGHAEVDARPGSGVEVRLHAPLRPKR